jgi:hypothetical protein
VRETLLDRITRLLWIACPRERESEEVHATAAIDSLDL